MRRRCTVVWLSRAWIWRSWFHWRWGREGWMNQWISRVQILERAELANSTVNRRFFLQKTIFPGYTRFVTPRWILWRDLHNAHVPVMTLHFQVKDDDDDYDASSVATEKTWSYSPLVPLGKSLSWAMRVWVNHWQSQIQIQWPVPFVSRVV